MIIETRYGNLFTVELLHRYFTDQLCTDFSIKPSAQTRNILSGHKIISKQYGYKLYAGIQLDATGKPLPVPEEGMQLTFFMQLNNPVFFNYTNLPFSSPSGKIYYFTNRVNNVANGKNFLSEPLPSYSAAAAYIPGDVVINSAGVTFQAIHSSDSGHPFDLSHTDHWMQVDANKYMSEADALQWLPSVSIYKFNAPQSSATIQVTGFNRAANNYTTVVLSKAIPFAVAVPSFQLDLSELTPGKYKLTVNGDEKWIYINDELSHGGAFAVIDIFNEGTLPAGYQLLNGTDLTSPQFSVYFLNRATIWKYVLASGASGSVTDNASVFQFLNPASTIFSAAPIPLKEKALDLQLSVNGQNYSPIACAAPQKLSNHVQGGDTFYCSEIFLNY